MTFGDIIVLLAVLGLVAWALYKIPRSIRRDADWRASLQDFAESKGLVGEEVNRGGGVYDADTEITWKLIRRWWSRNPALDAPPAGTIRYKGSINGLQFFMDTVLIRKLWTNNYDEYLRMAVELAELPSSLMIYPAGRLRLLARRTGLMRHASRQPRNLAIAFSSSPGDYAKEQSFLTAQRLRALEEFQEQTGGVYVYDGKLFLIRSGDRQIDLQALYDDVSLLAEKLAENS